MSPPIVFPPPTPVFTPFLVRTITDIYDFFLALITLTTRASLKRYHTHVLTLGLGPQGDDWDLQRIGTQSEKGSVDKELAELRKRLAGVEALKERRQEIEDELNKVWIKGGDKLDAPGYVAEEAQKERESEEGESIEQDGEEGSGESIELASS